MSAYVIVDIEVTNPTEYETYRKLVTPTIERYGGRYVARGGKTEVLEGDLSPHRVVILEFESIERAKAWWSSPEYAPVKQIRLRSANTTMFVVEGFQRDK